MVVDQPAKRETAKRKSEAAPVKSTAKTRKKSSARIKKSKGKKKPMFHLPEWFSTFTTYATMFLVSVLFFAIFYYFFIRPYAYRWKPCYGMKAYGVCLPYGYQVHGIDISHHQGTINWELLALAQKARFPIKFVFMKASEGGDFDDDSFERNFEKARQHGFIRGAYHFYNPKTDPVRQAVFFTSKVKLEPGDLPPVLDIEVKSKDMDLLRNDLKIWLTLVEKYYKVKPILYTSYKYKKKYLNDSIFNSYPYWIAHYYVDSVRYEGSWQFWQHTDAGTILGVDKLVDLNVFNGTLEQLHAMTLPHDDSKH